MSATLRHNVEAQHVAEGDQHVASSGVESAGVLFVNFGDDSPLAFDS